MKIYTWESVGQEKSKRVESSRVESISVKLCGHFGGRTVSQN